MTSDDSVLSEETIFTVVLVFFSRQFRHMVLDHPSDVPTVISNSTIEFLSKRGKFFSSRYTDENSLVNWEMSLDFK